MNGFPLYSYLAENDVDLLMYRAITNTEHLHILNIGFTLSVSLANACNGLFLHFLTLS